MFLYLLKEMGFRDSRKIRKFIIKKCRKYYGNRKKKTLKHGDWNQLKNYNKKINMRNGDKPQQRNQKRL